MAPQKLLNGFHENYSDPYTKTPRYLMVLFAGDSIDLLLRDNGEVLGVELMVDCQYALNSIFSVDFTERLLERKKDTNPIINDFNL